MAAKSNLELKVGIFALIALIILTIAIFSIGGVHIFRPGYFIKVRFNFASGINVGAPVKVAGVEGGEVKDIILSYDEKNAQAIATLLVWLNREVKIPRDSSAFVNLLGLIGETYLEIIPGKDYANLLKEGDILLGRNPPSTETMMEVVNRLGANFDSILSSINEVLDEETKIALKETIANFRNLSKSLDESLDEETKIALKETIHNFRSLSEQLDKSLEGETKIALKETIHNFRDFSQSLKVISGRLERGEGKLGAWLKPKQSRKKTKSK